MRSRLWVRLLAAFLAVALLAVGAVALIVRSATETSFRRYVDQSSAPPFAAEQVAMLQDYYAARGSWEGVASVLTERVEGEGQGVGQGAGRGGVRRGWEVLLADASGTVIAATDPAQVGAPLDADALSQAIPLEVAGARVGWLVQATRGEQALGETETRFLTEATNWLTAAALIAVLLAVAASLVLARGLARPLQALTRATRDVAGGALGRQVKVGGAAEVVELAEAFNRMSHDLAAGEALRQRMAADVAHELRTPVSVLRGHLEAMLDGVLPTDGAHLAVAHDQTIHLARLVDDLRLLTLAEAGRLPLERAPVAPEALVRQAVERFAPLALDAGVALKHEVAPGLTPVFVDGDRIQQVLGNLLANALRHVAPGGEIALQVGAQEGAVWFAVSNTGPGLDPAQAAHVFDRFWRAEDARARDSGGSGLGLAITQQLVVLHGGRIWVESAPARTAFVFELPAAGGEDLEARGARRPLPPR